MRKLKRWIIDNKNHEKSNTFLLTIICHGNKQGHLLDKNKSKAWDTEEFIGDLCEVEALIGKPKILTIQCCRGCKHFLYCCRIWYFKYRQLILAILVKSKTIMVRHLTRSPSKVIPQSQCSIYFFLSTFQPSIAREDLFSEERWPRKTWNLHIL